MDIAFKEITDSKAEGLNKFMMLVSRRLKYYYF